MNELLSALKQSARIWQGHQSAHNAADPSTRQNLQPLPKRWIPAGRTGLAAGSTPVNACWTHPGIGELHLLLPLMAAPDPQRKKPYSGYRAAHSLMPRR